MSFADELRARDPAGESARILGFNLQKDTAALTEILKRACTAASEADRRSVSVYCTSRQDDGYTEYGYIEELPTVRDCEREAEEFNRGKYTTYSRFHSASSGTYETRLYGQLICFGPDRLDYAGKLQESLRSEIGGMGFTSFDVTLAELDDIYVVHERRRAFMSEVLRESVSSRVAGKIYAFRLQASW